MATDVEKGEKQIRSDGATVHYVSGRMPKEYEVFIKRLIRRRSQCTSCLDRNKITMKFKSQSVAKTEW